MGMWVAEDDILLKISQCMRTENVRGSLMGYSSAVKERRERARSKLRGGKEGSRERGGPKWLRNEF